MVVSASLRFGGLVGASVLMLAGCGSLGMQRSDLVFSPAACTEKRFDIYFAEGQARLTEPALQAVRMTAEQLQGCDIRKVRVIGLASATGPADANQALSERRALAVVEVLEAEGWPVPAFEINVVGQAGAVDPAGTAQPLRRRAEVIVDAAPPR